MRADISEHSDGKSKGHGTVQFETPVEAVNAVCILLFTFLNDVALLA